MTAVVVFLGMAGSGGALDVFVFVAMLVAVLGFPRHRWPHVQRFHARREPDERDPTSVRFEGSSADAAPFRTILAAVTLAVFRLVLRRLYPA